MKQSCHTLFYIVIITLFCTGYPRSIHRLDDPGLAEIRTRWVDDDQEYSLKSYEFEGHTLFKLFDEEHINAHLLPQGPITFRNKEGSVLGETLDAEINDFVEELKKSKRLKKDYKNFKILKHNNFNTKKTIGALIVKFKKYPFVVKLFIESPHSFVRPFFRDLEQNCLFFMGGGISRYLVGFTRIKNLNYIKNRISHHKHWSKRVDAPRKWFWLPKKNRWFELKGFNIQGVPEQKITLPSIYASIADAIDAERVFSRSNEDDRQIILSLTTWLDERLDPNIPNYMLEKKTNKIVFVDTEHFPTNLGMREKLGYTSYFTWWSNMVLKYLTDNFCRTKRQRIDINIGNALPIMRVPEE